VFPNQSKRQLLSSREVANATEYSTITTTSKNIMPMLESNLPHHWVFSWKLPIIAPREQQATFARYIQTSIKKSWSHVNTVIEVEPSISRPPVLEIYGMIWLNIAGASPPHGLDIADLQTKIKRQARRVGWKIEDEEASAVLTLDLLSDKVKAGDWVYSSVGASSMASSYCGDLVRFMHLISVSIID
jgi:hypothetical protein